MILVTSHVLHIEFATHHGTPVILFNVGCVALRHDARWVQIAPLEPSQTTFLGAFGDRHGDVEFLVSNLAKLVKLVRNEIHHRINLARRPNSNPLHVVFHVTHFCEESSQCVYLIATTYSINKEPCCERIYGPFARNSEPAGGKCTETLMYLLWDINMPHAAIEKEAQDSLCRSHLNGEIGGWALAFFFSQ